MTLKNKRILITGASFIGSHLVPLLIKKGVASIKIVNLTSKHFSLLKQYKNDVSMEISDLRDLSKSNRLIKGKDIVIHLAADHGGRGYVDTFQGRTASNLLLDGSVFSACLKQDVEKVFFASSGCVYPRQIQSDPTQKLYLSEKMVKPPYDADNMYGWAKLMGELTLKAYYKDFGLKSAIGRFFTVYGENASESHAVIASIAKAFVKLDPYPVWGNGEQVRNWTYVTDIVEGIIKAIQKIDNSTSVNLGTNERITVNQMLSKVFKYTGFTPKRIDYQNKLTGPLNRVADISRAQKLLNWKPQCSFKQGLKRTIEWYFAHHSYTQIKQNLDYLLLES